MVPTLHLNTWPNDLPKPDRVGPVRFPDFRHPSRGGNAFRLAWATFGGSKGFCLARSAAMIGQGMSDTATRIPEDIKTAMRAKDSVALNALRALKSALMNAAIEKGNLSIVLDESEVLAVIRKQIKQRVDSCEQFEKATPSITPNTRPEPPPPARPQKSPPSRSSSTAPEPAPPRPPKLLQTHNRAMVTRF